MEDFILSEAQTWALGVTLAFMLLDIASGLMKAVKGGTMSSTIMREGLYHKATYILILAMVYVVEIGSAHVDLGFEVPLFLPVCLYIIGMEGRSIYENAKELNPELDGLPLDSLKKND